MTAPPAGSARRRIALGVAGAFAVGAGTFALLVMATGRTDPVVAMLGAYGSWMYAFVGVTVLWRRPGHGVGRLALAIGLAFAVGVLLTTLALLWHPTTGVQSILARPQQLLLDLAEVVSSVLLVAGLVLGASLLVTWFPDGHRTSRLGGLVEATLVVAACAMLLASLRDLILREFGWSRTAESAFSVAETAALVGVGLAYVGAFIDLCLRYRRADPIRRTQMRWVLGAEATTVAVSVALILIGGDADWLWPVWIATFGLPVLAIAIAITRYHLYEIDRIISRSISYLVVTAVLIAVFATIVLVLQAVISSAVAAPGSALDPRVVAISTLAVAALFNPLRNRVQAAVDRRFHRQRYDSGRLVAGFGGRMRDQVDLSTVRRELRATTVEALEPATTGVWLRSRADR
jgi:hypothetical protein